jgi:transposase
MEHMNLTAGERNELMALRRSRSAAAASVRRARLILMLDEGESWSAIKRELGCDSRFISTWGGRFVQSRLGGLHPGRAPTRDPAKLEARVLERTLKHKPRDGSTH